MVDVKDGIHRLYLAKSDTLDIHIDTSLPQHQIEGIRFLYRLFHKKKPGAILNDPSGYGKRVQTILFLNAMRPLLDKPVLVLCKEGKEEKWFKLFNKWSKMSQEVSVQLFNPPVLKSFVYINPMCHVNTFSRREWSVVVVDDTTIARDVLRASLNTHFKIWLTSTDMKKSLQTFSIIYKWLYPKDKFNVEDFQATKKKPSIVHIKSIILDAFMEDIVIRRKAELPPYGKIDEALRNTPKLTRKNKDATGKKIKRSKHKPEDEPPETINNVPVKTTEDVIENFIINMKNHTHSDMEVDDSLEKRAPVSNTVVNDVIQKEICKNLNEIDSLLEEKTMESDGMKYTEHNSERSCDILNNEAPQEFPIVIRYDSDTPDIDDIPYNTPESLIDEVNGSDKLESPDSLSNDDEINEIKGFDMNGINCENGKSVDEISSEDLPNTVDNNESKDGLGVSENKTAPKLDGIELKMKQLEELTMKKFKGSLLDSIF